MTTQSREDIASEWLPKIERWVKGYVRKKPEWSDHYYDFLADATIKLMERIDRFIADGKEFNLHFSCGLRITTMNAIATFLRREYLRDRRVDCSYTTTSGLHDTGQNPDEHFLNTIKIRHLTGGNYLHGYFETLVIHDPPYQDISTEQHLLNACKDQRDTAIIKEKAAGCSTKETATRTGLSPETIRKRLAKIKTRYDKAAA
jgi:DNA-directed RNA polymerase specialized sigma24 family protein